jgi:hypothetical protein
MPTTSELVDWARKHAGDLEADMILQSAGPGYGAYWRAVDDRPGGEARIRARAIAALDFLDRYAGAQSQWAVRGHDVFDKNSSSMETGARALGDVLRAWADQVDAGVVAVPQADAQGLRAVASTDLMEQVRKLQEDKNVHPAAPIVLAGAALEIALRSALQELGLDEPDRPSISTYATTLRQAQFLTAQDVKDVTQMGGLRNSAAHGEFEDLSRQRAGLMEQQVNMFLRRLADILAARNVKAPHCFYHIAKPVCCAPSMP